MLKRFASKKDTAAYKEHIKKTCKKPIRFLKQFQTFEQAESCLMENLNDKYPLKIIKHVYSSRNFIFHKNQPHEAETLLFYRHPSQKYKDVLLISMRYPIGSVNNSKSFIGGTVSYYVSSNKLRV